LMEEEEYVDETDEEVCHQNDEKTGGANIA